MATTEEDCIKIEMGLGKDVSLMWAPVGFYCISVTSRTLSALLKIKQTNHEPVSHYKSGGSSSSENI